MTVGRKARKTTKRFPSLPTALGNRWRDFHIPTAPITVSPSLKTNTERSSPYRPAFLSSGSFFDEKLLGPE
jgi:hypothetical protein